MRNTIFFGFTLLAILLGSNSAAQEVSGKPQTPNEAATAKDKNGNSAAAEQAVKPAIDDPNYIIGPEDELNINVWKEPDISRAVPVRPDGKISLPLLNDVQASGLTPMQLGTEITTRLKKFIADPQVTIIVTRSTAQRIYLVGEVSRAGAYPLSPNMTVMEALSSAGGCTIFAKQKKIYILRKENGKELRFQFNYREVLVGQRTEQNIVLKSGDTIVVP